MATGMRVTSKEQEDIVYAAGVLFAATELFLEGKIINAEGESRLKKACDILEQYGVSFDELAIYFKELRKKSTIQKAEEILERRGLMQSKKSARIMLAEGVH